VAIANDHRDGIRLSHLTKSYGEVRAYGDRCCDCPRRDRGAPRAKCAEKTTTIDMVLGLTRPDTGTVSVFGSSPAEAAKAGAVGAMLQTGSLVQFLSVRELLTMVASLYPHPFELNDVLRLTGTAELADRAKAKLSGGQTRSVRFANSAGCRSGSARAGRADGGPRRRGAS